MKHLRQYIRSMLKEETAREIIRVVISEALQHGEYEIVVDVDPSNPRGGLVSKAMLGGEQVGYVQTEQTTDGQQLYVRWAEVDKPHQKRGIASAMYDAIEEETGKQLTHGDIRSSVGALHLWKKRLGETDEWMIDQYVDGLYDSPGLIQLLLNLPEDSQDYTDEQVIEIAKEDLGL